MSYFCNPSWHVITAFPWTYSITVKWTDRMSQKGESQYSIWRPLQFWAFSRYALRPICPIIPFHSAKRILFCSVIIGQISMKKTLNKRRIILLHNVTVILFENHNNCIMDDYILWPRSFIWWPKMAARRNEVHIFFPQDATLLEISIFSVWVKSW